MPVPAAKVKEICTPQEATLVRASRNPALSKLKPAEVKQYATRARKLYDKWLALSREQSRARSKQTGFGESKANTSLKVEIFGDALQSFEAKLAKQSKAPGPKSKAKTKKTRSAGHRASRAEVRAELALEQELMNKSVAQPAKKKVAQKKAVKKTAQKASPQATTSKSKSAATASKKPVKKTTKKSPPASQPTGSLSLGANKKKTQQAKTAAKKSRIKRSGLTTRVLGHVSARGKRAQARRDSKR